MTPIENKDNVSLTCHSESQALTFWWLTPRGSPDGDRILLSPDNKTLTIYNVTREDQGQYECEIRNPVSVNKSDPFTLNIKRNGFLLPGWAITLIVVGVAVGVSLMVCCWFFRDTGSFCKPSHQPPSSALLPSLQPQGRKKYEQRQEEEERGPPFHAPRSVQPSPSPSLSTDDGHIGCLPETHLPSILKSWCRGPGRGGLGGHPLPDISLSSDPLLKAQSPGLPLTSAS
ncbi:carcinoembryonic antigen-related cell adhesion molecule 1-like isoform X1 [Dromiciops gliroides]|uniref:carcinoembryonic antigen-related cell adhesion molecule 1-like isoform X1 n=1 Tax=Dromiciops gliroides TaxID=33562 RepID=UPI001CC34711|nr:carcinoembryonic antigen-related cell adhesion molecule 1-like isoform X1 [Dromiciops gliroides]